MQKNIAALRGKEKLMKWNMERKQKAVKQEIER